MSNLYEEILQRVNIVDIVRNYLPNLKKSGANYKALCPFHKEKTPSFIVSPTKNIYHCFGCHKGGNAISFVMEMEHLSFWEAAKKLARQLGITLRGDDNDKTDYKKTIYSINEWVSNLYVDNLFSDSYAPHNKQVLDYLLSRGLTLESIKKFKIGFAPNMRNFVVANNTQFSNDDLYKAGIVYEVPDSKEYIDFFRNRIILPIFNISGRVCGFGGRSIDGSEPKYINTPETELFSKRRILYALNFSKEYITKAEEVIIVEGYTDAILLHQYGFNNTVATLGTALTEDHLHLLSRYAKKIILVFDGDEAGVKASERSFNILADSNFEVVVVIIPNELDPADFIVTYGASRFQKLLQTAKPILDFLYETLKKSKDLKNISEKVKFIDNFLAILNDVKNPVIKDHYIKKLAEETDLKVHVLYTRLGQLTTHNNIGAITNTKEAKIFETYNIDYEILSMLIRNNNLINVFNELNGEELLDKSTHPLLKEILSVYSLKGCVSINDLQTIAEKDTNFLSYFTYFELSSESRINDDSDERFLKRLLYAKKKLKLKEKIDSIKQELNNANLSDRSKEELMQQFTDIQRELKEVEATSLYSG